MRWSLLLLCSPHCAPQVLIRLQSANDPAVLHAWQCFMSVLTFGTACWLGLGGEGMHHPACYRCAWGKRSHGMSGVVDFRINMWCTAAPNISSYLQAHPQHVSVQGSSTYDHPVLCCMHVVAPCIVDSWARRRCVILALPTHLTAHVLPLSECTRCTQDATRVGHHMNNAAIPTARHTNPCHFP
jgi:hypothetical protein